MPSDNSFLRIASPEGMVLASAVLREAPQPFSGRALEQLYVEPAYRGQGFARALIQEAKLAAEGPLYIKPRPFGDMPASIEALRQFYTKEGFVPVDNRDTLVFVPSFQKSAANEESSYQGKPSSPNTVKFTVDFQGFKVRVDRPKGFVMVGKDAKGTPWKRTYQYDYGFFPKTEGGDGDELDVFLGPNKNAPDAYWATQTKPDGTFDEYKVFLGFDSVAQAKAAYVAHIPKDRLQSMATMSLGMMQALLGSPPKEDVEKTSMWNAFYDELIQIHAVNPVR